MIDHTTELYCIIDDLLKAKGHREDARRRMSDAEVLTTALVSAQFFGSNMEHARRFMRSTGLIPQMLSRSRLNRRRVRPVASEGRARSVEHPVAQRHPCQITTPGAHVSN